MSLSRESVEDIVFGTTRAHRYTQDSPVLPDVWVEYARRGTAGPVDLLLTPNRHSNPAELAEWLVRRLRAERATPHWRTVHAAGPTPARLTYNESYVVVALWFDELVRAALPLTRWWREHVWGRSNGLKPDGLADAAKLQELARRIESGADDESFSDLFWMTRLVGRIAWELSAGGGGGPAKEMAKGKEKSGAKQPSAGRALPSGEPSAAEVVRAFRDLLSGMAPGSDVEPAKPVLWSVSLNRPVQMAVWRSVRATKADAATRLFNLSCARLRWAVVDSGIDATHPAFRRRDASRPERPPFPDPFDQGRTRVVATYDFTRLRRFLTIEVEDAADRSNGPGAVGPQPSPPKPRGRRRENAGAEAAAERHRDQARPQAGSQAPGASGMIPHPPPSPRSPDAGGATVADVLGALDENLLQRVVDMRDGLRSGRSIDWRALLPLLEVPHREPDYDPPGNGHGTHVAGILAGDWRLSDDPRVPDEHDLQGLCPDLELYDLRVLDADGQGDEFAVLAALQFIRWLNASKDEPVVHGVNVSMSLLHDVSNYACGRTPVCEECERLVGAGVVVVAAAGNEGYAQFNTPRGPKDGYRSISITDPGNADGVITVGATHRFKPHTYGVSYFSSRGPTGDGRPKPDLVAPGEKIKSMTPQTKARPASNGRPAVAPRPWSAKTMDGTSMAAPHVSGAAALLMARHGELIGHPARVKQILCKTATDLGRERFFQGAGMVDVLRALQSV